MANSEMILRLLTDLKIEQQLLKRTVRENANSCDYS